MYNFRFLNLVSYFCTTPQVVSIGACPKPWNLGNPLHAGHAPEQNTGSLRMSCEWRVPGKNVTSLGWVGGQWAVSGSRAQRDSCHRPWMCCFSFAQGRLSIVLTCPKQQDSRAMLGPRLISVPSSCTHEHKENLKDTQ